MGSATLPMLAALLGFAIAALLFATFSLFGDDGGVSSFSVGRVEEENVERIITKALQKMEDKRALSVVAVQPNENSKLSLDLDQVSKQLMERMEANLQKSIQNYIDDVASRLSNGTFHPEKRTVTVKEEVEPLTEVRWMGGLQGKRCIDMNPHWNGAAKAWNCQGMDSNFQKILLTPESHLQMGDLCLDATGVKIGSPVKVSNCKDVPEQKWKYAATMDPTLVPTGQVENEATGLCMTVGTSNYPEPVILKPCDKSCTLLWSITRDLRSNAERKKMEDRYNDAIVKKEPRIVCWINTHGPNHATKATAVNNTWGRRCTHLLFMSTSPDDSLNIVLLDLGGKPDSRNMLRPKSKMGWLYVYEHFLDKGDWFLKGDDDSYVVMENLKTFLRKKDPNDPVHYGRLFHYLGKASPTYYSGGSTIILSHEALKRLGDETKKRGSLIWPKPDIGQAEDMRISQVLDKVGVRTENEHAEDGRHQFLSLGITNERALTEPADRENDSMWFWKYSKDAKGGAECCSPKWVSSHYMKPHGELKIFLIH